MGQYDEFDPGHGEPGHVHDEQWNRHMMETDDGTTVRETDVTRTTTDGSTYADRTTVVDGNGTAPENREGGKEAVGAGVGALGGAGIGMAVGGPVGAVVGGASARSVARLPARRPRATTRPAPARAGWPAASPVRRLAARLPDLPARSSAARSARPVAPASATRPRKRPRRATPSWWTATSNPSHDGRPRPPGGGRPFVCPEVRHDRPPTHRPGCPADRARPTRGLRRHGTRRVRAHPRARRPRPRRHDVRVGRLGGPRTLVPTVPEALRTTGFGNDPSGFILGTMLMVLDHATEFDVIHSHLEWSSVILARATSVPVAATFHGRLDLPWARSVLEPSAPAHSWRSANPGRRPPRARLDHRPQRTDAVRRAVRAPPVG